MSDFKVGQRVWLIEEKKHAVITKVDDITFFEKVAYDIEIKSDNYKGWRFDYQLHETADDMFEALGFEKSVDDGIKLAYSNGVFAVIIDVKDKTYTFSDRSNKAFYLDLDLHLAIHQKMIELGWL